ncbi:MAG: formate--tetrahydrofolate ligase [Vicinamibacteria bacterium]|nr:formate--tetrahydrofolate ligase [Vicinamibacteria bacterium]
MIWLLRTRRRSNGGLPNLEKHIENARLFGHTPIVALNRFATDGADELAVVRTACDRLGVPCADSEVFARGGDGGRELAEAVVKHAVSPSPMKRLYDWNEPLKQKIEKVCKQIYGAEAVAYSPAAERDLKQAERLGFAGAPICMANTQMSLSDDAGRPGRPTGFTVTVKNVVIAARAGFVVPLLGDIIRMPGLNATPQAERMDLVDGKVVGLLGG